MIDPRPVGYIIGLLAATLGVIMLVPLTLDYAVGDPHWMAFAESAVISIVAGGMLALACANATGRGLSMQQSFLLTTGVWLILPVFGALPFMLGRPDATFTDAVFEAMSGMTTTGTTVFVGLDALPMGTNLWRGILQWLGGLGIVIVAMIFLPVMKVGGMQFFRSEGFDTLGKILPRALDISAALIQIYLVLTLACVFTYLALGLPVFEAVVHALTTVSTGGFSSSDRSFALFQGPAEYACAVFMVLAALPFVRFVQVAQGDLLPLWRDPQVRAYLRWNAYAIGLIVAYEIVHRGAPLGPTLRETTFNVVSTFTGTGLTSVDLNVWGTFPFVMLIVIGLIGGCTSSTTCSVKVFRYLILIEAIKVQIRRLQSPNALIFVDYEGRRVSQDVINSVILFFTMFILTFGVLSVLLSLTGLQTKTAVTAAWTAIANVGPVFGPEVSATGAVDGFSDSAKWLMILGMLLGRLELLSVYVLLLRRFWRG
ncbi:TrkH family potassium uptake protein [Cereibacter sphaeroides]|uniref:TrkH family potassium uptake protein n=1 Tax=Rhodobacterales TaxID=204455 RepID=UPI000BBE75B8|nr:MULTISPECIES: TrkH family potassium uptake protein [Paracoccaceae]MCE6951881.1 TrkH family potassium uptake protein [Cereibacter sphaeroides]MCE6961193.1 TrkH family potassium uptake protein [Cereibacter sphaeroides]MCE6970179.1 TrkH family potassium uptake protein [Cereibacter sphaeroides]MCE6974082.1 TrkH family potassium uptake protein [Cereibacter sphaeroides]